MLKKLFLSLAILFSFTLISCNNNDNPNKDTSQEIDANSANNDTPTVAPEKTPEFTLPLYSLEINSEKLSKSSSITFKGDSKMEDCLKEIATITSTKNFDSLPITFERIEVINGKKVAIINLEEKLENKDKSPESITGSNWIYGYFQGSTGGYITTTILTENFLQKEYKGPWIDGVKFTYNGKPISSQHVESLSNPIYK